MGREIDREQALAWLHDRLGHELELDARYDCGDQSISVVSALGELRHSSDDGKPFLADEMGDVLRNKLIGLYSVGTADFDIQEEVPWEFDLSASGDELVVGLHGCVLVFSEPSLKVPKVGDA
jgi:hypothetical protein